MTSMIIREGKDLSLPGGWKPTALGSVLARLLSGVMDVRLRSFVKLSSRQVGFVEGNRNFANGRALHESIRIAKKRQVVGQVLDDSKAFASVPHEAIARCLESRGELGPLRQEILAMYEVSTTII